MSNKNQFASLFVIILNWNLPEETIACIQSVQASSFDDLGIVVVDNASTDNSIEMLREQVGNAIVLLENETNLGFAGGVNVGVQHALEAGAGSILLLNNDTIIHPKMIEQLMNATYMLPNAKILTPAIYFYDAPERIWRYGDKEVAWLPMPLEITEAEVARNGNQPFKLAYVTACGVLIKREVFEAIGLFDTRFFMYFEDADFCQRARQAGYEIWCVPEAKMWHKVSMSAKKDKPANRYAISWGRVQFYRSYPERPVAYLTSLFFVYKLFQTTLIDLLRGDFELIKSLWQGTWHGYKDALRPQTQFPAILDRHEH